mmetsp:Transcript_46852/g.85848  ORF Transcript_46852/g.85848 Transcript_46852/m.85848 type:complete len:371 (+) Transcript_46852:820-1932(+)
MACLGRRLRLWLRIWRRRRHGRLLLLPFLRLRRWRGWKWHKGQCMCLLQERIGCRRRGIRNTRRNKRRRSMVWCCLLPLHAQRCSPFHCTLVAHRSGRCHWCCLLPAHAPIHRTRSAHWRQRCHWRSLTWLSLDCFWEASRARWSASSPSSARSHHWRWKAWTAWLRRKLRCLCCHGCSRGGIPRSFRRIAPSGWSEAIRGCTGINLNLVAGRHERHRCLRLGRWYMCSILTGNASLGSCVSRRCNALGYMAVPAWGWRWYSTWHFAGVASSCGAGTRCLSCGSAIGLPTVPLVPSIRLCSRRLLCRGFCSELSSSFCFCSDGGDSILVLLQDSQKHFNLGFNPWRKLLRSLWICCLAKHCSNACNTITK